MHRELVCERESVTCDGSFSTADLVPSHFDINHTPMLVEVGPPQCQYRPFV